MKRGVLSAIGELILFSDADLSTSIEHIDEMMALCQNGSHIAIASRYIPGAELVCSESRERMGRIFNKLAKAVVCQDIGDTQCGFKVFRKEVAKEIFERCSTKRFAFDVEILLLARRYGYRISEVPAKFVASPYTSVRIFRDSISMVKDLLLITLREMWV